MTTKITRAKNKTRNLTKLLSLMLALSILCVPVTSFAAGPDPDAPYEVIQIEDAVANSESVKIYDVNDGNTLEQIAQVLRTRDYESVLGFDYNGNKLFNKTSYITNHCYTTSTDRRNFANAYGTTIVHNHPSSQAFSNQDLKTEATYQTPRAMVISNLYVYVLEPTTTGWGDPDAMYNYYDQRYNVHYNEIYNLMSTKSFRSAVLTQLDAPDDGSVLSGCRQIVRTMLSVNPKASIDYGKVMGIYITHCTMLDVAQRFNMSYYRCETNDFDFTDDSVFYSEAAARQQYQDSYGYWYY